MKIRMNSGMAAEATGPIRRVGPRAGMFPAAAAAVLALVPLPAFGQTAASGDAPAMLAPGDMVQIEVWRRPELSGEFPVLGDGGIGHPLYKGIVVTGVPVETARERVRAFLGTLEAEPQYVFVPLLRVAVGGEVRAPDLYHLPPMTTVAEAVAQAGGPTERGKPDDVRLRRGGGERQLDLRDPTGEAVRLRIRSGDEIVVKRRGNFNFLRDVWLPLMATSGTVFSLVRVIDR